MVDQTFKDHFESVGFHGIDFHVCMGDIFDRPHVAEKDILTAYNTYRRAVQANKLVTFVLIAGNHDLSRDRDVVTSFDLLREMLKDEGVIVVQHQWKIVGNMLFVPFAPLMSSTSMVADVAKRQFDAAFGHWDIINPSNDSNLIPYLNTDLIVTGHDHVARVLDRDGQTIHCTGSMQPYSHSEDPEGKLYRTVKLPELLEMAPEEIRNLNIRVDLLPGEELPDDLDALSIQVRKGNQNQPMTAEVEFGAFDMTSLWHETMASHGVSEDLSVQLFQDYRSRG